jgi:hypothetical protein
MLAANARTITGHHRYARTCRNHWNNGPNPPAKRPSHRARRRGRGRARSSGGYPRTPKGTPSQATWQTWPADPKAPAPARPSAAERKRPSRALRRRSRMSSASAARQPPGGTREPRPSVPSAHPLDWPVGVDSTVLPPPPTLPTLPTPAPLPAPAMLPLAPLRFPTPAPLPAPAALPPAPLRFPAPLLVLPATWPAPPVDPDCPPAVGLEPLAPPPVPAAALS